MTEAQCELTAICACAESLYATVELPSAGVAHGSLSWRCQLACVPVWLL